MTRIRVELMVDVKVSNVFINTCGWEYVIYLWLLVVLKSLPFSSVLLTIEAQFGDIPAAI